jgi:hypothetical protein
VFAPTGDVLVHHAAIDFVIVNDQDALPAVDRDRRSGFRGLRVEAQE